MKKIIIFLLVFSLFLVSCQTAEQNNNSGDSKDNEIAFGITQEQCQDANGYWNECGSPCAGTDAEVCIQMCQVQCQCGGIAGFNCPQGYKCRLSGKISDEMGVCVRE